MKTVALLQQLESAGRAIFTANEVRLLFGILSDASLHMALSRLAKRGVLKRLGKGLFALSHRPLDPFLLANLLHRPSYISLESALNLHGLLIQTPHLITSVTTGRPLRKQVGGYDFLYRHLPPHLWFGFERNGSFLVAVPEKAFLDWFYLASRRGELQRREELAWKRLDMPLLDRWASSIRSLVFQRAYRRWRQSSAKGAKDARA